MEKEKNTRSCGILLHITSLPSRFGIGDLGPAGYRFVDFLERTRQKCWQILPFNPSDEGCGNSPYSSLSAFAGNTLLISPERLKDEGFLDESDLNTAPVFPENSVSYREVRGWKDHLFEKAYQRFAHSRPGIRDAFQEFCRENKSWLEDYAVFVSAKVHFKGLPWFEWPGQLKNHDPAAIAAFQNQMQHAVEKEKFLQFVFHRQWTDLKNYSHGKGVRIFGDVPIYVNYDSSDVWSFPEIFKLDASKRMTHVAGCPPDYFSETGQLWGNPVYNWEVLRKKKFDWWIRRLKQNLKLCDLIRIDHFRGLVAYWEVPAHEKTAVNGKWVNVPVEEFFTLIQKHMPSMPIIAEDLGVITDDVMEIMTRFGFPGMKILMFAFGNDMPTNPYIPHNHIKNCVVYTGTHDNNTVRGWFDRELSWEDKNRLFSYLGREISPGQIHWEMMRMCLMSVADMVIIPMQDLLGLGEDCRMNRPSTVGTNWQWKLTQHQLDSAPVDGIVSMLHTYHRT